MNILRAIHYSCSLYKTQFNATVCFSLFMKYKGNYDIILMAQFKNCGISNAKALEIPQSSTKPSAWYISIQNYIESLVWHSGISRANALEIRQSCTEPSI